MPLRDRETERNALRGKEYTEKTPRTQIDRTNPALSSPDLLAPFLLRHLEIRTREEEPCLFFAGVRSKLGLFVRDGNGLSRRAREERDFALLFGEEEPRDGGIDRTADGPMSGCIRRSVGCGESERPGASVNPGSPSRLS